jgi:hypothetical protein
MGDAAFEASMGASTAASGERPREGEGANAGLFIPRVELGGAMRAQVGELFDVGLVWDYGAREGAYRTSPDQPTPDNGSVWGGGASAFASLPTLTPGFRVGVGLDLLVYSIPYVEYRTCATGCLKPYTTVDRDRENVGVYSLSIIPSWRAGRVTLFGGGTMRNHPTITKGSVEGPAEDLLSDEVEAGPPNFVVSAGVELEVVAGLRAMALVYQPITTDPVEYGPTLGLALTIPLARRAPAPMAGATARR